MFALLGNAALCATVTQTLNAQAPKPATAFYIGDILVNDAQAFAPYGVQVVLPRRA